MWHSNVKNTKQNKNNNNTYLPNTHAHTHTRITIHTHTYKKNLDSDKQSFIYKTVTLIAADLNRYTMVKKRCNIIAFVLL